MTKESIKKIEAIYDAFGSNVRTYRKKKGLLQEELGKIIGTTKVTIGNIEGGHYKCFLHYAYLIALALDVSLYDLLPHPTALKDKEVSL